MVTEQQKMLALRAAHLMAGRPCQIQWFRPWYRKTRGLAYQHDDGRQGVIVIDPKNEDWIETLAHECAHIRLHWRFLPIQGKGAKDWRHPGTVHKDIRQAAERREVQACEWAAAAIENAQAFVPMVVNGRYITKDEKRVYLLKALARSI